MPTGVLEYDLDLDIDFPAKTFRGRAVVSGWEDTAAAALDAVDLTIDSVRVDHADVPFVLDAAAGKLSFEVPTSPPKKIDVTYSGRASENVQTGLFAARLNTEPALTTMLWPESCRRVLPCLDRPDRKAVFRLRVTTQPGLTVISNMPGAPEPTPNGRVRWTFAPTPPMSPYLLYLGIGPFEEVADRDGPIPVFVAGPPGWAAQAKRTAGIARQVLRGYTQYFDIPYPLPKLHLVAFHDFWAGMENWGAISGRSDQYLLDESASPRYLEYAETVIAHEIAHQWFGDLVTAQAWDDLWLNEAFATFAVPIVQELASLRRDPWAEFVFFTMRGLRTDSLSDAKPVKPATVIASEIVGNADEITYLKGARLIRMIRTFAGPDAFRDGITEYLRDHEFANARSDDLWEALEEESGRPVARVMRSWVERAGHPCITVRQDGPDVELTQRRFTLVPQASAEPPWPIPLVIGDGDRRETTVFDTERHRLTGRIASRLEIDPGRTGFFRVLYSPELRREVIARLPSASPEEQCAVLEDAEGFLVRGDYSLGEFAEILDALSHATSRMPVAAASVALSGLTPVLSDLPEFVRAARRFCAAQTERLGEHAVPGEPDGSEFCRDWVFGVRVRVDPDFARDLARRFDSQAREPAALRPAILTAYALQGTPESVERLLAVIRGGDPALATLASFAIGETPHVEQVLRTVDADLGYLPLTLFVADVLPFLARPSASRAALWEWLSRRLRDLESLTKQTTLLSVCLSRALPYVGLGQAETVRRFFAKEHFPEAASSIRKGLELLRAHEALRNRLLHPETG